MATLTLRRDWSDADVMRTRVSDAAHAGPHGVAPDVRVRLEALRRGVDHVQLDGHFLACSQPWRSSFDAETLHNEQSGAF